MGSKRETREGGEAGGSAPASGDSFFFPYLLIPSEVKQILRIPADAPSKVVRKALDDLGVPVIVLTQKTWRVREDLLLDALERAESA